MDRPYVYGANFKMNQTAAESLDFYEQLAARLAPPPGAQLYILPPFTSLPAVTAAARGDDSGIWIGAQNMHWAQDGPYTGEISAPMLVALAVAGCGLGLLCDRFGRRGPLEAALSAVVDAALPRPAGSARLSA